MKIIDNTDELIKERNLLNQSIGFVPTMGALHKGHLSLIKESIVNNDITIVSIFVNPTQFLEGEDFGKYPKTIQKDLEICKKAGVDILFLPEVNSIYFDDEIAIKAPKLKGFILEGLSRPGHFDGVLQIVLKLFNIVKPSNAYFGKKDAQQLYLIQKMVRELFLNINIVPCEIVRDEDGLALSSRNIYLSKEERKKALLLSKALKFASKMVIQNEFSSKKIVIQMSEILKETNIEYISIVNREFDEIKNIELKNTIILIATKIGDTRLIDNMWI